MWTRYQRDLLCSTSELASFLKIIRHLDVESKGYRHQTARTGKLQVPVMSRA